MGRWLNTEARFSNVEKFNAKKIYKLRIESIRFRIGSNKKKISEKSHWQTFVSMLSYGT